MARKRPGASKPPADETSQHLEELRESFAQCDRNGDGRIQYAEFKQLLENLDAATSPDESWIGFQELDTDNDQLIDFDEFVSWWSAD